MNRATKSILERLRDYESRNVTFIDPDGSWPIVWDRARGVHVWDAEGRKYLDLTAAFGVAAAGHANPVVVRAGRRQMGRLLHAMGDVYPHALKAELARELSRVTFERWGTGRKSSSPWKRGGAARRGKTIFNNSGFESVEAALKTAMLATGRRGVIAFEQAYHGLGYGTLNVTSRDHFRSAFRAQLGRFGHFVPFPMRSGELETVDRAVRALMKRHSIGAVLVEPVQARGGIRVPPDGFLPLLRERCDETGSLLIADEIYTGFGRTGVWFACEHSGTMPDLICLGKALTGGFPLSACVGRADVMDAAWPKSEGEAIHTSTFLGHPVGCAMALAQMGEVRKRRLVERSASLGRELLGKLTELRAVSPRIHEVRGMGLMAGIELCEPDGSPATEGALRVTKGMLRRGFILLPEGEHSNVISLTPPLT
ncbi:MAG TPA: aspartate aminotransferase family protein, partial [Methylomirabilota bacterium]|nr:aspartate aminotransferase family protein [Methylomirabilota bacterium]